MVRAAAEKIKTGATPGIRKKIAAALEVGGFWLILELF
jgi:hypothetical protein